MRQKRKNKKIKKGNIFQNIIDRFISDHDFTVLILVLGLTLFGICMVFSAGYYYTTASGSNPLYLLFKQGFNALTGFLLLFIFSNIDYHAYSKPGIGNLFLFGSLILLILTFFIGANINGATRWIELGPINITPSELSKLAMIIFTSVYLAKDPKRAKQLSSIIFLCVIMIIHAILIIKQPNLSTAILICAIMIGILFVAGLKWRYILFSAFSLGSGIIYILTFKKDSHWYQRLTNFTNPFADSQGAGYQVAQSLIALGNGGFRGRGIGQSIAKTLYLPEPQNDFIMAIIGEELGFIGIFILLIIYLYLIWKCMVIASTSSDKLGLFLTSGVAIMLGLQVILNLVVVTSSGPATGVTLPFVSYGGTSMWVFMTSIGIVLSVSKHNRGSLNI